MEATGTDELNIENVPVESVHNGNGEDSIKAGKRESLAPAILPTRNSSLPRGRGRAESSKSSKSSACGKQDPATKVPVSGSSGWISTGDIPPTPPPKNEKPKPVP